MGFLIHISMSPVSTLSNCQGKEMGFHQRHNSEDLQVGTGDGEWQADNARGKSRGAYARTTIDAETRQQQPATPEKWTLSAS